MLTLRRAMRPDTGMSLIELMVACLVLVIGMMGGMIMVVTAIASNNRNRMDTTGTALSQMIVERIYGLPTAQDLSLTVTDCAGNTFSVATKGDIYTNGGKGAKLNTDGSVDFTQALTSVPAGYSGSYTTCGKGTEASVYDIRWNVIAGALTVPPGCSSGCNTVTTNNKIVTVSSRNTGGVKIGGGKIGLRYFAPPQTLRTIVGP